MFIPDFDAICLSPIWREQIKPLLEDLRQSDIEEMAAEMETAAKNNVAVTPDKIMYWSARIRMLTALRDLPEETVELKRYHDAQEKKDAYQRERDDRRANARF